MTVIKRNRTPSDNSRLLTNAELNLHIQICWSSLENFATLPNGDNFVLVLYIYIYESTDESGRKTN